MFKGGPSEFDSDPSFQASRTSPRINVHVLRLLSRGVAFRGDAQAVVPDLPYRFGDGLQSWVLQAGAETTLSVAAFDESAVPDAGVLHRVLSEELTAWGLPHRLW